MRVGADADGVGKLGSGTLMYHIHRVGAVCAGAGGAKSAPASTAMIEPRAKARTERPTRILGLA